MLPDDTLWTADRQVRAENVGYFHNPKCQDFVFFLPKVLLEPKEINGEKVDRVFCTAKNPNGFAPEEIIDPEHPKVEDGRKLDEQQKSFLYEFAVWVYRAIARFDETHKDSDIINKLGNSLGEESVYKQFTYAKNMLQLDLNLFLNGDEASDKVNPRARGQTQARLTSPRFTDRLRKKSGWPRVDG